MLVCLPDNTHVRIRIYRECYYGLIHVWITDVCLIRPRGRAKCSNVTLVRYNSSNIGVYLLGRWIKSINNSSLGLDVNEFQVFGEYHAFLQRQLEYITMIIISSKLYIRVVGGVLKGKLPTTLSIGSRKSLPYSPLPIHIFFSYCRVYSLLEYTFNIYNWVLRN